VNSVFRSFISSHLILDNAPNQIYELVPSPRHRRAIVVLVASSYVTWTYQTHTFSNKCRWELSQRE
jgi:hypothetical protein